MNVLVPIRSVSSSEDEEKTRRDLRSTINNQPINNQRSTINDQPISARCRGTEFVYRLRLTAASESHPAETSLRGRSHSPHHLKMTTIRRPSGGKFPASCASPKNVSC